MKLLPQNLSALNENEISKSEYLEKQQLETEFYKGLKKDIELILNKAWDGKQSLNEDETRYFK
jgi:hypothetical protein